MPVTVEVRYFAAARELCGTERESIALAGDEVRARDALAQVAALHPPIAPLVTRMRVAINGILAQNDDPVRAGDELSVLPPVAGGAPCVCGLRASPLSLDEVADAVRHPGAGAVALFVGTVRAEADGKAVARLDYEAQPEMAEREMHAILDELERDMPGVRLAALHRTGQLAVGELAVVVAASAPHRAEAFTACRDAIEKIKARVPIWKHEWAPDGTAHWVNLPYGDGPR
jgi:molybdopterin synthase catalytic subunit